MHQFPQEAKALVDEIVREIRNIRHQQGGLVNFESASTFRNRLVSLQSEASNLQGCENFVQTFLAALEEEVRKLFEQMHLTSGSIVLNPSDSVEDNVVRLYPKAGEETTPLPSQNLEASAGKPEEQPAQTDPMPNSPKPPAADVPLQQSAPPVEPKPHETEQAVPQQIGILDLVADYLELLIDRNQPVEISRLRTISQEIRRIQLQARDPKSRSENH